MLIEDIIAALVKDIMINASIAQESPSFAVGKFALACRHHGDDLRAVVEGIARKEVERRFTDDFTNTVTLLTYSEESRRLIVTKMILEVVKRLVSLAGTP